MPYLFFFLTFFASPTMTADPLLLDLGKTQDLNNWYIVNDGVMGGLSQGKLTETDQALKFYGQLSLENNGGFTRCQRVMEPRNYSPYTQIQLRARGDGRTYTLTVENTKGYIVPSYQASFVPTEAWQVFTFNLADLDGSIMGRKTGRNLSDWAQITHVGIMLKDKKQAPFEMEVDYIRFLE